MKQKGPALIILAAGLGSRYGSYKQLDSFGPDNETIMDLSIMDAIRAGFEKIVLIINRDIKKRIDNTVVRRYRDRVKIETVCQELHYLPDGFELPQDRTKPWGTGHAVLSAREAVNSPFAVINADDFYGSSAFIQIKKELDLMSEKSREFCMLGYLLKNTLSAHGGVSRGICGVRDGYLVSIAETKNIRQSGSGIAGDEDGKEVELDPDTIVSMNFWGFSPALFAILDKRFHEFLENRRRESSAEFFITDALDGPISWGEARIRVLTTREKWFGVTYTEDREQVRKGIQDYLRHQ